MDNYINTTVRLNTNVPTIRNVHEYIRAVISRCAPCRRIVGEIFNSLGPRLPKELIDIIMEFTPDIKSTGHHVIFHFGDVCVVRTHQFARQKYWCHPCDVIRSPLTPHIYFRLNMICETCRSTLPHPISTRVRQRIGTLVSQQERLAKRKCTLRTSHYNGEYIRWKSSLIQAGYISESESE